MAIPHFIYSPMDGYLGYYQFRAIMNKFAMNILVQFFCGHMCMFSFLLGKYVERQFWGHCVGNVYLCKKVPLNTPTSNLSVF